jgi:hypothetical protein
MKFCWWDGKTNLNKVFHLNLAIKDKVRVPLASELPVDYTPPFPWDTYPYRFYRKLNNEELLIQQGDLLIVDDNGYFFKDLEYLNK